jgi:hypothetical protein
MRKIDLIIRRDETDPEAAGVFVDASIDGHPYRFLLDTGAAMTLVKNDAYTRGFICAEKRATSGVFAAGKNDLIYVPRLELGPVSRKNYLLARAAGEASCTENVVGMDLLKDFRCHFDFEKNILILNPHNEPAACRELVLDRKKHPYIDIGISDVPAKALWDTGAGLSVVDVGFINKHPLLFRQAGFTEGTDATGVTMRTPMFVMEPVDIDGHRFPSHRVAGVDLSLVNARTDIPMDLIMGYNTMSRAAWFFDFPGRMWGITGMLANRGALTL